MSVNITYLVGNGFDLQLGMNTSPTAFLSHFVESNKNSNNPHAKKLAQTIKVEGIETWSDFEMSIGHHSRHFSGSAVDASEYLGEIEALEMGLEEWLGVEDERATDELIDEKGVKIVSSFANVRNILARDGVHVIDQSSGPDTLNFLCFNYTSAFSRSLRRAVLRGALDRRDPLCEVGELVFPHGTLKSFIVCGVDGPDQIANADFQNNEDVAASIIKETMQREDNFAFDQDAMNLISDSDIVCIFGMSLGRSDRRWWKHIASTLAGPFNRLQQLVIFSHEMNGENLAIPPVRWRAKKTVRDYFFTSAEVNDSDSSSSKSPIQAYPTSYLYVD